MHNYNTMTPTLSKSKNEPQSPSSSHSNYDFDNNETTTNSIEMKKSESPDTRKSGTRFKFLENDDHDNDNDDDDNNIDNNNSNNISRDDVAEGSSGVKKIKVSKSTYLFVFCAALNSCNLGYDIGVNTSAAKLLTDGDSLGLTDNELELFMGSLNLFAAIGAIFASSISDNYGRRGAFVVAAIGFIFGVLIQSFARSFAILMIGRVFVGLGIGFGLAIDPIYIAEVSPSRYRGRLVTWSEIAVNIGIVFGFASGLFFYNIEPDLAWRYMFACGIILPCLLIYCVIRVMPESPRYLISKGKDQEAKDVLEKIYPNGTDIDMIVKEIKNGIRREIAAEKAVGWEMIFYPTPAFRRMLLVGVGSAVAQQLVGIDAIQYFMDFILERAGAQEGVQRIMTLIALGVLKLLVIIFAGKAFDKKGRRPLLFLSLIGITVSYFILAITFGLEEPNEILGIIGLALFLSFFSAGMGPGAWLVPAEVFSTAIRAKGMSLATFMNRVTATVVTSTFLSVANTLTYSGFFILLGFINFGIFIFFYKLLPETKGRSLEEMSIYFAELTGDDSILEAERRIRETIDEEEDLDSSTPNAGTFA